MQKYMSGNISNLGAADTILTYYSDLYNADVLSNILLSYIEWKSSPKRNESIVTWE